MWPFGHIWPFLAILTDSGGPSLPLGPDLPESREVARMVTFRVLGSQIRVPDREKAPFRHFPEKVAKCRQFQWRNPHLLPLLTEISNRIQHRSKWPYF